MPVEEIDQITSSPLYQGATENEKYLALNEYFKLKSSSLETEGDKLALGAEREVVLSLFNRNSAERAATAALGTDADPETVMNFINQHTAQLTEGAPSEPPPQYNFQEANQGQFEDQSEEEESWEQYMQRLEEQDVGAQVPPADMVDLALAHRRQREASLDNYRWSDKFDVGGVKFRKRQSLDFDGSFELLAYGEDEAFTIKSEPGEQFNQESFTRLLEENKEKFGELQGILGTLTNIGEGFFKSLADSSQYIDRLSNLAKENLPEGAAQAASVIAPGSQLFIRKRDSETGLITEGLRALEETYASTKNNRERIAEAAGIDKTLDFISRGSISKGIGQGLSSLATGVGGAAMKLGTPGIASLLGVKNFTEIAENETVNAMAFGVPEKEAIGYGALSSALQTPIETAADVLTLKIFQNSAISQLTAMGLYGSIVSRAGVMGVTEGGAEAAQGIMSRGVAKQLYNDHAEVFNAASIKEEAAVGMIIGALFGSMAGSSNNVPDSLTVQVEDNLHKFQDFEETIKARGEIAKFEEDNKIEAPAEPTGDQRFAPPTQQQAPPSEATQEQPTDTQSSGETNTTNINLTEGKDEHGVELEFSNGFTTAFMQEDIRPGGKFFNRTIAQDGTLPKQAFDAALNKSNLSFVEKHIIEGLVAAQLTEKDETGQPTDRVNLVDLQNQFKSKVESTIIIKDNSLESQDNPDTDTSPLINELDSGISNLNHKLEGRDIELSTEGQGVIVKYKENDNADPIDLKNEGVITDQELLEIIRLNDISSRIISIEGNSPLARKLGNRLASERYTFVNPKPLEEMQGLKEPTIQLNPGGEAGIVFQESTHKPGGQTDNVLGYDRQYDVEVEGVSGPFLFEVQSDMLSQTEDDLNRNIGKPWADEVLIKELKFNKELASYYESQIIKKAFLDAKKAGQSHVIITDAETAMMTEQHDKGARADFDEGHIGNWTAIDKEGNNRFGRGNAVSLETAKDLIEVDPSLTLYQVKESDTIPKIEQEKGMRAAYDPKGGRLHNIARKISGDKGTQVDLGKHQNGPSEFFDGKDNVTAIAYKVPEDFGTPTLFGGDRQKSQKKTQPQLTEPAQTQPPLPPPIPSQPSGRNINSLLIEPTEDLTDTELRAVNTWNSFVNNYATSINSRAYSKAIEGTSKEFQKIVNPFIQEFLNQAKLVLERGMQTTQEGKPKRSSIVSDFNKIVKQVNNGDFSGVTNLYLTKEAGDNITELLNSEVDPKLLFRSPAWDINNVLSPQPTRIRRLGIHPKTKAWVKKTNRFVNQQVLNYARTRAAMENEVNKLSKKFGIKKFDSETNVRLGVASHLMQYVPGENDVSSNVRGIEQSIAAMRETQYRPALDRADIAERVLNEIYATVDLEQKPESVAEDIRGLFLKENERGFYDGVRELFESKKEDTFAVHRFFYGEEPTRWNNWIKRTVSLSSWFNDSFPIVNANEGDLFDSGNFEVKQDKSNPVGKKTSIMEHRRGINKGQFYDLDFLDSVLEGINLTAYEIETAEGRAFMKKLASEKNQQRFKNVSNGVKALKEMHRVALNVHHTITRKAETTNNQLARGYMVAANAVGKMKLAGLEKLFSQLTPFFHAMTTFDANGRDMLVNGMFKEGASIIGFRKKQKEWINTYAPTIAERATQMPDILLPTSSERGLVERVGRSMLGKLGNQILGVFNILPDRFTVRAMLEADYVSRLIKKGIVRSKSDWVEQGGYDAPVHTESMNEAIQLTEEIANSTVFRPFRATAFQQRGLLARNVVETALKYSQTVTSMGNNLRIYGGDSWRLLSKDPEVRQESRDAMRAAAGLFIGQAIGFAIINEYAKYALLPHVAYFLSPLFGTGEEDEEKIQVAINKEQAKILGMEMPSGEIARSPRYMARLTDSVTSMAPFTNYAGIKEITTLGLHKFTEDLLKEAIDKDIKEMEAQLKHPIGSGMRKDLQKTIEMAKEVKGAGISRFMESPNVGAAGMMFDIAKDVTLSGVKEIANARSKESEEEQAQRAYVREMMQFILGELTPDLKRTKNIVEKAQDES